MKNYGITLTGGNYATSGRQNPFSFWKKWEVIWGKRREDDFEGKEEKMILREKKRRWFDEKIREDDFEGKEEKTIFVFFRWLTWNEPKLQPKRDTKSTSNDINAGNGWDFGIYRQSPVKTPDIKLKSSNVHVFTKSSPLCGSNLHKSKSSQIN